MNKLNLNQKIIYQMKWSPQLLKLSKIVPEVLL